MLKKIIFTLTLTFLLTSKYAFATLAMGSVVVRQVGNLPCFHVKNTDEKGEKFQLLQIIVAEKKLRKGWDEKFPPATWRIDIASFQMHKPWPPQNCIQYGLVPEGFSEVQKPSKIIPKKNYGVFVNTTKENQNSSSSGFHNADFCMVPSTSGTLVAQQILWDEIEKRWRTEVCDAKP